MSEQGQKQQDQTQQQQQDQTQQPQQSGIQIALEDAQQVIALVAPFASMVFPGAQLAGMGLTQILGLAYGLGTAAPDVVAAYDAVKAAVDGGAAPTADQWAALNAATDAAHQKLQADAAANIAAQQKAG